MFLQTGQQGLQHGTDILDLPQTPEERDYRKSPGLGFLVHRQFPDACVDDADVGIAEATNGSRQEGYPQRARDAECQGRHHAAYTAKQEAPSTTYDIRQFRPQHAAEKFAEGEDSNQ